MPAKKLTRSSTAIEAWCLSVVRRLPKLQKVKAVRVVETVEDPEGRNWRLAELVVDSPISASDRARAERAVEILRQQLHLF